MSKQSEALSGRSPLDVELDRFFGAFDSYHIADLDSDTLHCYDQPGITWVMAGNGIWKVGINEEIKVMVKCFHATVPGLPLLRPAVMWQAYYTDAMPGRWLPHILAHARQQGNTEFHYLFAFTDTRISDHVGVMLPKQDGTAGRVCYEMPESITPTLDLHSHHRMPAYFSDTDDQDDGGLSVSAVIGRIHGMRPEIRVRLNCWGWHQEVPARLVFDHLGPFVDAYRDGLTRKESYRSGDNRL